MTSIGTSRFQYPENVDKWMLNSARIRGKPVLIWSIAS